MAVRQWIVFLTVYPHDRRIRKLSGSLICDKARLALFIEISFPMNLAFQSPNTSLPVQMDEQAKPLFNHSFFSW